MGSVNNSFSCTLRS